jgi:argininosuccinate synthase
MEVTQLHGQEVMVAVSGGLDSCTITHWLARRGVRVVAYTADLGQPDEHDIDDVRQRMLACGAEEAIVGDLKEAICRAGLQVIQASARYEGGYWNTTGIARHVVVRGMVPELRRRGIGVMGHGATATTRSGSSWPPRCWLRRSGCTLPGGTRPSSMSSAAADR